MIVGGLGWIAKDPLASQAATATMFLEVGVASILLFGLLMFAEMQARRSRGVEGFCGSCGVLWTKAPNQRSHTEYRATSGGPEIAPPAG
jgi:hypothetical protein